LDEDTEGPRTRDDGAQSRPQMGEQRDSHGAASSSGSNRGLWMLFGALALVSIVLGVFSYRRYASSEKWVAEGVRHMEAVGPDLDVEGCVDEAVSWYDACDQHDANAAVCLQAVGILMHHCLSARERDETCELYLDPDSSVHQPTEGMRERARNPDAAGESGRWVYARCEERGMACRITRECACAQAYRAIDSFCRTGQEAVQL
jgi:hypothetical protein